jgi:hypothetical protein
MHAWIGGILPGRNLLATPAVVAHYAALTKIDFSYVVDDTGGGAAGSTYVLHHERQWLQPDSAPQQLSP